MNELEVLLINKKNDFLFFFECNLFFHIFAPDY